MVARLFALVGCGKRKLTHPAAADALYTGLLFRKSLAYALSLKPQGIFILSAKYGLLRSHEVIEPYDNKLSEMTKADRSAWAERVLSKLRKEADLGSDHFVCLAGREYLTDLTPSISMFDDPLAGKKLGARLQWLSKNRG